MSASELSTQLTQLTEKVERLEKENIELRRLLSDKHAPNIDNQTIRDIVETAVKAAVESILPALLRQIEVGAKLQADSDKEKVDRAAKKNNIVIYGVPESVTDLSAKIEEFYTVINENSFAKDVREVFRLGKPRAATFDGKPSSPRPIKLILANYWAKTALIGKQRTLKTELSLDHLWMRNDLTQSQRDEDFLLQNQLSDIRDKVDPTNRFDYKIRSGNIIHKLNGKWIQYEMNNSENT